MKTLRDSLICLLLGVLGVLVLRLHFFVDQASFALADVQAAIDHAAPPLTGAALELQGAAREQRRYYKATGKALALATVRLGRLIENTDARLAQVSRQAAQTLAAGERAFEEAREQVAAAGYETTLALAAARGNLEQAERLWPAIRKTTADAGQAVENLERATANVERATESVKLALEPLRKPTGRLTWIFRWLLGLPKINIP
jgi:chromosome segregation ATPase